MLTSNDRYLVTLFCNIIKVFNSLNKISQNPSKLSIQSRYESLFRTIINTTERIRRVNIYSIIYIVIGLVLWEVQYILIIKNLC